MPAAGGGGGAEVYVTPEGLYIRIGKMVLGVISISGPTSYTAGGYSYQVKGLQRVVKVLSASIDGGYKVDAAAITISGNTLTIPIYYYDYAAAAAGGAIEVADLTDLSTNTIQLVVLGY